MTTRRNNLPVALGLTFGGLGLMWALTEAVGNVWHRMALFYLIAVPVALLGVKLEWTSIFRPSARLMGVGLIAAGMLYGAGWLGSLLLREIWPDMGEQVTGSYSLLDSAPGWQVWPLLVWIIVGEEIVWRLAVTLSFTERWRGWGVPLGGLAFALVHLPWGPPLLLVAAVVFGSAWSFIAFKTRSFWASFVAHLGWDILVMFVARYS
ncbi:MAG: CPBP family intramembrane metalloprotease [Planctomycetes bacterium]|nr:CPBP family intramembrane metalloprotease [Planctomycetota bacterium]